ncbi:MAG: hypothetical protein H6567_02650 [Lewinellaceae bacterium]|nr:hypothetical protein [Lewinellaceae bacterium]
MKAVLWDGVKQIHGELILDDGDAVRFEMEDFQDSSLSLVIPRSEIASIRSYKVYDILSSGMEIITKDGKKNVFVVEEILKLKK